jgi:hypothetical protein
MQRARPVPSPSPVGPGRWSFRLYHILQRAGTKGRRYEIRTPAKELVALCRIKKKSDSVSMFADDEEKMEILRFNPKTVRQYAAAFEVVDTLAGRPIGEFRKKVYRPLNKSEWFIFNADGEPVGMVVEAPTPPGLLGRIRRRTHQPQERTHRHGPDGSRLGARQEGVDRPSPCARRVGAAS